MREIVHLQAGQCGNQIGAKVCSFVNLNIYVIQLIGVCETFMWAYHTSAATRHAIYSSHFTSI